MTPALTSTPHATPTPPPTASLTAPISPLAAQPVPHVLSTSAVTVSPVVRPHLMQTYGAAGF
jgi:hypothetical protein